MHKFGIKDRHHDIEWLHHAFSNAIIASDPFVVFISQGIEIKSFQQALLARIIIWSAFTHTKTGSANSIQGQSCKDIKHIDSAILIIDCLEHVLCQSAKEFHRECTMKCWIGNLIGCLAPNAT